MSLRFASRPILATLLSFGPGAGMDIDVSRHPTISFGDLDPDMIVSGYGMYVKTGALPGGNGPSSSGNWSRRDAYVIEANRFRSGVDLL